MYTNGKIIGLACNQESPVDELMALIKEKGMCAVAADHMCQFFWSSLGSQFNFPIAHFPVKTGFSPAQLINQVGAEMIATLAAAGFISIFLTW